MLLSLSHLSVLANGEDATHISFDSTVKACSATVTQQAMTIFCHWVEKNENTQNLTFYSYPLESVAFCGISYKDWNRAAMYLQNSISFTVQKTLSQVKEDLPRYHGRILCQSGSKEEDEVQPPKTP
ncbi:hypothetical protein N7519_006245 [Penicillium mononematosum]|uniref:uncharacterized protein n=1 Tax=Penicillium mononematosum TaxID=268346 RepID=UPI002546D00A|nr:uncharacterized protein N7519_006245 [Penicillium mononematosum]KAJ6184944.1 hypothetical protein N7519_006245 [Penicillium mononematosum]